MNIRSNIKQFVPPIIWSFAKTFFAPKIPTASSVAGRYQNIDYQGVSTVHNMRCMHEGFFARIYEQWRGLNPANAPEVTRLRQYLACMFAEWTKDVEGDFLTAGISYGVAPRVIYDFIDFPSLGKVWHFIDPFTGANVPDGYFYNTNPEIVKKQYPNEARIILHENYIPDVFPIKSIEYLAFVHLNTAACAAEAESLPYLYDKLSPGGIILIDTYAFGNGAFETYNEKIKKLGATVFTMVTGQCVIRKKIDRAY